MSTTDDERNKSMLRERVAESLDILELDELQALVRMVRSFELRREIFAQFNRRTRRREQARRSALRALRETSTYSQPPQLRVIDGGGDE